MEINRHILANIIQKKPKKKYEKQSREKTTECMAYTDLEKMLLIGKAIKPSQMQAELEQKKLYPCPQGLERHHIDGNTLNNNPENIKIVTVKEHRILDGRLDKLIEARRKKGGTKNKKS